MFNKSKHRAKTPLLQLLMRALRISRQSRLSGIPASELYAMQQEEAVVAQNTFSRRQFIRNTAMAAVALGAGGLMSSCDKDDAQSLDYSRKITIVGGGMAGLHAAYILQKSGIGSTIYESSSRAGGRMYTAKNLMGDGFVTELGGEFIDSTHEDMLNLADEFGLTLLDTLSASETALIKDAYFFEGQHYSLQEVITAFDAIAPQMSADIDSLPDFISYADPGTATNFDNLSISAYLASLGVSGWLRSLLEAAYITEYGLEADVQSCINMLYLISTDVSAGTFDIYGESDERYKIEGGNQQITDKLADKLSEQIHFEHKLTAIKQNANGNYTLTFDNGGSTTDIVSEFVIMTIPFTILRELDISQAGFSTKKMQAINELGYGTNAKLFLGFNSKPWRDAGYTGYLFTDEIIQSGWDNTQLQNVQGGSYTVYLGGNQGVSVGDGTPASQADIYLPKLNSIFTGMTTAFNSKTERFHWPTFSHAKGSYACYKTGQWTSIAGAEQETSGKMFFAGEHCSFDYQGYMNGAAETGRVAAEAILNFIG